MKSLITFITLILFIMSWPLESKEVTGWILTFEDDFLSRNQAIKNGASKECFDRTPICKSSFENVYRCSKYKKNLKHLNKCYWNVYHSYNVLDQVLKEGRGQNAYHPKYVQIKNGYLYLKGKFNGSGKKYNCKNKTKKGNLTRYCPFVSGAIGSLRHKKQNMGFDSKYGRFEVRAKMGDGPGSWSTVQLINAKSMYGLSFLENGVIKLNEKISYLKGRAISSFENPDILTNTKVYKQFLVDERKREFKTYAVEWGPKKIQYFVNDKLIGEVKEGENNRGAKLEIPSSSYFWHLALNFLPRTYREQRYFKKRKKPMKFKPVVIDYIRVYRRVPKRQLAAD